MQRWRLVLGKYADRRLQGAGVGPMGESYGRMDRALDYLYGREYQGRGVRKEIGPGSLDPPVAPGAGLSFPDMFNIESIQGLASKNGPFSTSL